MCRKLLPLFLLFLLASCQSGPLIHFGSTPTPTLFPDDFELTTTVGENKVSIDCKGSGEPTILLEYGTVRDWPDMTVNRIAEISRTCVYARAGMLDTVTEPRRTTQDQVNDLHALLEQAGVPGPYILAGHSIAGFNMLLYTDQYPDEIVGIVCVDCRVPSFDTFFLEKCKAAAPGVPEITEQGIADLEKALAGEVEWILGDQKIDYWASRDQVVKVTSLGDLYLIVLVAEKRNTGYPEDVHVIFEESWLAAQQKLSEFSTHSRLEIVPSTDHDNIPSSDSVVKAIQEVYDAVKKP